MKFKSLLKALLAASILFTGFACDDKSNSQAKTQQKSIKKFISINFKGSKYELTWTSEVPVFKIIKNGEVIFQKRLREAPEFGVNRYNGEISFILNGEKLDI
jgi:hypothetical protein